MSGLRHRLLVVRVLVFVLLLPLVVRLKLPHLARVVEPRRRKGASSQALIAETLATVEWALGLAAPQMRSNCLARGVTRLYFLRRVGADVSLHFGLDVAGAPAAGHCWLVKDEQPFLEDGDPRRRFAPVCAISHGRVVALEP